MSHPAQSKYGACKAQSKHDKPCGLPIVRGGFCMFHQPEEIIKRLLHKLERNQAERDAICADLQKTYDLIK